MGVKSVLKKIGKVALVASPYIAAPFTGGASLAATGLANKAAAKWGEHDAKDAIAHGLEPSKFDQRLGKVADIASMASAVVPSGALGKIGLLGKAAKAGKAIDTATKAGKAASILGKVGKAANIAAPTIGAVSAIAGMRNKNQDNEGLGPTRTPPVGQSGGAVPRGQGSVMPKGGYRYNEDPMNQLDQSSPNLSQSIFQGRQQAIANQPFRHGYDIMGAMPDATDEEPNPKRPVLSRMPVIQSNARGGGGGRRMQANY